MKHLFIFSLLLLVSLASAETWENNALPDILEARYEYAVCDVDYAKEWLSMRESCGAEHDVSVFDSSDNMDDLDQDLEDLREAADEANRLEFGLTIFRLGRHSLDLIGAIIADALGKLITSDL